MKTFVQYLIILIGLLPVCSIAQEFDIKKVELTPETIILYYDLIDTTRNRAYVVNVYSSRDNFMAPLQNLRGDFGLEVRPGLNKKIEWNSKEELGSTYDGGVELEIRGRIYIPFIKFENLNKNMAIKRGVKKKLTWTGGTKQYLNFTLYDKDGKPVDVFTNIANSHEYDLVLPKKTKPGKGYTLLVSDSKNKDQAMRSQPFGVKRRFPLALQIVPVIAIGGVVSYLLKPPVNNDIVRPPNHPDNEN
jgi:hypothetical protein